MKKEIKEDDVFIQEEYNGKEDEDWQLLYKWRTNDHSIFLLTNKEKLRLINLLINERR